MEAERKRSKLSPVGADPAEGLALSFADMLAYACEQRANPDSTAAVHTYRKSVRRARSLVKLVRPSLPRKVYEALNTALGDAARATSDLRDQDVAAALLEHYACPEGAEAAVQAWRAQLSGGDGPSAADVTSTLEACAQALGPVSSQFAAAVADLTPEGFSEGLAASYRRARKARRKAIAKDLGDEEVHTWRKRVKEVRYQLEVLTSPAASLLNQAFGDLAQDLGRVTDWTVLEASLHAAAGLDPEQRALLEADLAQRHQSDARAVAGASGWLFSLEPAAYLEVLRVGLDYRSPFAGD